MGGVFRIVDKDGKVTFSDRPAGQAGASVQSWKPGDAGAPKSKAETDYDTARQDIALARKHVPNLVQYLDYLDYLRHHSPIRFDRLMQQLQHDDPQAWLKLQKYPQFQPLGRSLGMAKAGEARLALAVGVATGNYGGSIAKWAESTLKDLMKRDGYYADVLGACAHPVPEGGTVMRKAWLLASVIASMAACGLVQAASVHKPVPARACAEPPLSSAFDPADPQSLRKHLRTAPRIVLAMGPTRHEQLRALLARGENPNVCIAGSSILTLAAASGDLEEVEILLDGGADPDSPRDSIGGTALLMALDQAHFDIARLLIDRGADARAATDGNMTSLIKLAGASPAPGLQAEQLDLAEMIVKRGVPIDARLAGPHTTALMMAAIRGNAGLVQLLLRLGADPRLQDTQGQTALAFALKKGHADVAELLSAANPVPTAIAEPAACAASPAGPCPPEPRKTP